MSSTMGCRYCRGLCAGAASRCHQCGTWIRKQDYYSTPEGPDVLDGHPTGALGSERELLDSVR